MESAARDPRTLLENVLTYLPGSTIRSFAKGKQIYGPGDAASEICLLLQGRVKLLRLTESGVTVVVDICHPGDLFGESALLNIPREGEQAITVEPVKIMAWSATEIAQLISGEPRLAVAFMQIVAKRCLDFKNRLESFSAEDTSHRLGRALVEFADRLGGSPEDSATTIAPLTHELLAQYVGTSREIVSHHMSMLRRGGYIGYSRAGIVVRRNNLRNWLLAKTKHA